MEPARGRGMRPLRLFCLPHAGGSAQLYRRWAAAAPPGLELAPLELAGRGVRLGEPFYLGIREAAEDLLGEVLERREEGRFALFGHSMGALIAYELAVLLQRAGGPQPEAAFLSAKDAPQVERREAPIHGLPEALFIERIRRLGGCPDELFEQPELLRLFLPVLRADFRLVETYRHQDAPLLETPGVVMGGRADGTLSGSLGEWRRWFAAPCRLELFEGGHFYAQERHPELLRRIADILGLAPERGGAALAPLASGAGGGRLGLGGIEEGRNSR
ncbi:thioesterase II family protein [Paenibacillus pasadenensis]|uniref:Thioesterase n=1 Tax=Paenibacillus pasadenensis TaxID=217090 RepID=A0A2N5N455_9BACL|nr:alpha/beta fold hydrolase [Paenibacillus pasadenensis]PLT45082.1 Thioesterase [Paenibacillus pasadenensis]